MIQKYFKGEIQEIVSGIRRRKREPVRQSLEAYKLYLGFKDCLLVKNFSIGMKG